MRAGWKTSEFWGVVVGCLVTILNGAFGWDLPAESLIGIAVMVAGYALARGQAKKATV